jgi:hypothetical protein
MNTKHIIAISAIALFGGTAIAQEATFQMPTEAMSTTSRAAVKAELAQARANGTMFVDGAITRLPAAPVASTRSRDQVRAEAQNTPSRNTAETNGFRS